MNSLLRFFVPLRREINKAAQSVRRGAHVGFVIALTLMMLAFPGKQVQAQPIVIATIPFGSSRAGVNGANPVTDRVYVAREDDPSIAVIDGNTNSVLTTIPTAGFHAGLAVDPITNRIFVSQQFAGTVRVIDGATNMVLLDFAVPGLVHTVGDVAVNPATNRIFVIRANNNDISVHDGTSYAQLATVSCAGNCHSGELAVNATTNRIYVVNPGSDTVTVLDGVTNTVITTITVGDEPRDVDVNPVSNLIYVTNIHSNTVSVIDGGTDTVVASVTVGTNPLGVRVNPATNRIYASNFTSEDVSIIDGATNTVVATVPVDPQPSAMAVTPNLSRVYVTQGNHSVSVIEDLIQVAYNFSGFFSPVDNPGPGPSFIFNKAKAGSAIPVKFSLDGDQGLDIFAAGYPRSEQVDCTAASSMDSIEETVTAGGSSLSYDPATDQYTYVWKTNKAWAGSCRKLTVRLADGTDHIAYFNFVR